MKSINSIKLSLLLTLFACSSAIADAGSMSCYDVNRPHDPTPVRNWLRGFVSASGYSGNYQNAAAQIGGLCKHNPSWSLSDAANYWLQSNTAGGDGSNNTSVSQQQIQQKQLIINVNPNIAQ